jgi:hypothetical protein
MVVTLIHMFLEFVQKRRISLAVMCVIGPTAGPDVDMFMYSNRNK